jgi:hypothetical protein
MLLFFQILVFAINSFPSKAAVKHEFHTSISQFEYNTKEKIYEVSLRFFTDDLEKTLGQAYKNPKLRIQDNDQTDALVSQYLRQHFTIRNTQKKLYDIKYIGKENEDIATWVYFELSPVALKPGNQLMQNALLEVFDDQINIVNILNQGQKKSYLFDKDSQTKVL